MTDSPGIGEVWWADLDPVVGSEANKTRPVVVVSSEAFASTQLRVVVPFTSWQPRFERHRNKVRIAATPGNGLEIDSAADGLLVRSLSIERFQWKSGSLEDEDMKDVMRVVALVLELHHPEADEPS